MTWYCCYCEDGGWGDFYTACPSCNHQQCSNCTVESHHNAHSSASSQCGDASSIFSRDAREPLTTSPYPPPTIAILTAPNLLTRTFNIFAGQASKALHALPFTATAISTPLTQANVPLNDETYQAHGCMPDMNGPTDGGEYVEYLWYCCNCHDGPYSCSYTPGCVGCNDHTRCNGCRVERVVRKY